MYKLFLEVRFKVYRLKKVLQNYWILNSYYLKGLHFLIQFFYQKYLYYISLSEPQNITFLPQMFPTLLSLAFVPNYRQLSTFCQSAPQSVWFYFTSLIHCTRLLIFWLSWRVLDLGHKPEFRAPLCSLFASFFSKLFSRRFCVRVSVCRTAVC